MRKTLMTVGAAGLLAACGSSAARSSTTRSASCGPKDAVTLASSAVARVYVVRGSVFGCAVHSRGAIKLGQRASCIGSYRVAPVTVTGALAAYGLEHCGIDTGSTNVVVRRLTDGRRLRSVAAAGPTGPESYQSVTSIVLKNDGAVAWIATGGSIVSHQRAVEVHRADRRGNALLDSGSGVAIRSLRLRGSTLSWRNGGATRTAKLS